ncbi:MAG: hypothetical protein IPJ02_17970 [Chitinophagaceae bacterium]|nr:hypothetical protein [Chitinophagaceae bacterium]
MAVPLWRAYKDWFKLADWISSPLTGRNVSSDFKQPSNVPEAFLGGGALEDWGAYQRNSSVTILPGIGPKAIERFKAVGIEKWTTLKSTPDGKTLCLSMKKAILNLFWMPVIAKQLN